MKKTITLLLLAAMSSALAASAAVTKTVSVGKFSKISVSTAVELHYTKGTTTSVRMEADRDIFSEVSVSTEGSTLNIQNSARKTIQNSYGTNDSSESVKVWVTSPEVSSFAATVGSSITIENPNYSISKPLNVDITVGSRFNATIIEAPEITLTNSVGSTTKISEIESKGKLSISNTVGSTMTLNSVRTPGNLTFTSGPAGKTTIANVKAGNASFTFGPTDSFSISQKIEAKSIEVAGSVNANITLEGIAADAVTASGGYNCNVTLAGKADKLNITGYSRSINYSRLSTKSPVEVTRSSSDDYYDFYDPEQARAYAEKARKESERIRQEGERIRKDGERIRQEGERIRKEAAKERQRYWNSTNQFQNSSVQYYNSNSNSSTSSSKESTSTTLTTGPIKSIEASRSVAIYYTQGPLKPVKIVSPANRKDDIKVEMEGTTLVVKVYGHTDETYLNENNARVFRFQVYVQAPDVESFELSGGAGMRITSPYDSKGNFSIDAGSGSGIAVEHIAAANISIDLSSGSSIQTKDLKADNISIDQSSGSSVWSFGDVSAKNRLSVDVSSGAQFEVASISAQQFNLDLSSGARAKSEKVTANEINLDVSAAANATFERINARDITINADTASTVTLSGKCDNLNVTDGILKGGRFNYYDSDYYSQDAGTIIIDNLNVGNISSSGSRKKSARTYYNYDSVYDYDNDKADTRTSDRPMTEKEKVEAARKVLKSLGLSDESIREALKSNGYDINLLDDSKTDKSKKVYTDDDLIP